MEGRGVELPGVVCGVRTEPWINFRGEPLRTENPRLDIEVKDIGTIHNVKLVDSVDEARDLLGTRVRVTIEALDG